MVWAGAVIPARAAGSWAGAVVPARAAENVLPVLLKSNVVLAVSAGFPWWLWVGQTFWVYFSIYFGGQGT